MGNNQGDRRPFTRELGQRMAAAREELGLDQAEVAARLDINENTYGAWERGYRLLPLYEFIRVCQVLHKPPHWFLAQAHPDAETDDERTLLSVFRSIRSRVLRRQIVDLALEFSRLEAMTTSDSPSTAQEPPVSTR